MEGEQEKSSHPCLIKLRADTIASASSLILLTYAEQNSASSTVLKEIFDDVRKLPKKGSFYGFMIMLGYLKTLIYILIELIRT